jgi:hypothetical protein
MKKLLIITLFLIILSPYVYGYAYSDYDWTPYNGHQCAITLDWSNWLQAETWAQEVGGHLVTINNAEEDSWLAETYRNVYTQDNLHPVAWIGLEYIGGDRESPSSWKWVSGDPVSYWNPYPPGLDIGNHMYLENNNSSYPGTWNCNPQHDTIPTMYPRGIIEIPEPTTILLFAFAGLLLRRRK